jgi:hypothetical protein
MIRHMGVVLAAAYLLVSPARSQDQLPPELSGLPSGRGVYFHSPSGWESLPLDVLIPSFDTFGWVLWPSTATVKIKGPAAQTRTLDLRPVLYIRGISPSVGIHLVRESQDHGKRKLRMNLIKEGAEFVDEVPIEITALAPDIVRVWPLQSLPVGDYSLATGFQKGASWIFLAFDFGISPHI